VHFSGDYLCHFRRQIYGRDQATSIQICHHQVQNHHCHHLHLGLFAGNFAVNCSLGLLRGSKHGNRCRINWIITVGRYKSVFSYISRHVSPAMRSDIWWGYCPLFALILPCCFFFQAHSVVFAFFLPASVTLTLYWRIYRLARNRQRGK
jgi:hypothetical protein